jgi:hypothetical protein
MMKFQIGDRVRLSELGRRASKKPGRSGVILGASRTRSQFSVKWDDAKVPQMFHCDYLEVVGDANLLEGPQEIGPRVN